MDEMKILAECKKAIALLEDKTYTANEFASHIVTIVRDEVLPSERHVEQLERFIKKVSSMREAQRFYFQHKAQLTESKNLEIEVDRMMMAMLSKGYTIERFKNTKPVQASLL